MNKNDDPMTVFIVKNKARFAMEASPDESESVP